MRPMKKTAALTAALCVAFSGSGYVSHAEDKLSGTAEGFRYEYSNGVLELNYTGYNMDTAVCTAGNLYMSQVTGRNSTTWITMPDDERYIVTFGEMTEAIIDGTVEDENYHFHYFYPVLRSLIVDIKDGEAEITLAEPIKGYSEEKVAAEMKKVEDFWLENKDSEFEVALSCFDVYTSPGDCFGGSKYISTARQLLGENVDCFVCEWGDGEEFSSRLCAAEGSVVTKPELLSDGEILDTESGKVTSYTAENKGSMTVISGSGTHCDVEIKDSRFRIVRKRTIGQVDGDVNGDGTFNLADLVTLQRWLIGAKNTDVFDWETADLCRDGRLDSFDMCLLKQALIEAESKKPMVKLSDHVTYSGYGVAGQFLGEGEFDMELMVSVGDMIYEVANAGLTVAPIPGSYAMKFMQITDIAEDHIKATMYTNGVSPKKNVIIMLNDQWNIGSNMDMADGFSFYHHVIFNKA